MTSDDAREADNANAAQPAPIPGFRLRTLVGMRWFATLGQLAVVAFVAFGLGFALPLAPLVAVVAVGVWVNIYTTFTRTAGAPMTQNAVLAHLIFDTLQISAVLFLTGGVQNPFVVWLVMPAMLAASSLPRKRAAIVLGFVMASLTILALVHYPLPWRDESGFELPRVYNLGLWVAMTLAVGFTAAYANGVALAQARLAAALAATQAAVAREERLTALDGLAAAAAHELGTPLGTIQITAREMERELDGDLREDARLLISQTQRCQAILQRLSSAGEAGDAVHGVLSLNELLGEAAKPFLNGGPTGAGPDVRIVMCPASEGSMPTKLRRIPEVIYGLRNLVENAAKYAAAEVVLDARWDERFLTVKVRDDGPGFTSDILARLGEPYPGARTKASPKSGLGLGFFIAKTLLERTGARLSFGNAAGGGAAVEVVWPLANLVKRSTSKGQTRPIETAPAPV